jgi:hypothetical protein
MTTDSQTRFTYRVLDPDGAVLGERDLPTDGEALAWADELRSEGAGLTVLRVERRDDAGWSPVEEGGTTAADRGPEDL